MALRTLAEWLPVQEALRSSNSEVRAKFQVVEHVGDPKRHDPALSADGRSSSICGPLLGSGLPTRHPASQRQAGKKDKGALSFSRAREVLYNP